MYHVVCQRCQTEEQTRTVGAETTAITYDDLRPFETYQFVVKSIRNTASGLTNESRESMETCQTVESRWF